MPRPLSPRWLAAVVIATLGFPAGVAGASPRAVPALDPELSQSLQGLAPGGTLDVVVTLRDQAALGGPAGGRAGSRAAGVQDVVTRLQRHAQASQRLVLRALKPLPGVTRVEPFWIINGFAITATGPVIRMIAARPEVASVALDRTFAAPAVTGPAAGGPVEPGVAQIAAPTLWARGLQGQGAVVAVLDTGVDATHPDLAAAWRGGAGGWFDPSGEHPTTPTDVSGHGTQTTGVIVGGGTGGSAIGVAPQARWIAAKIFNDRGVATVSGVHQAFQWVLDPDRNPATADAPNVVNASWTTQSPGCDLTFQLDLRSLRAAGILPVFAAGNVGPTADSSSSPGNNPEAFAVGATDAADALAAFSSRGPSSCGEPRTTFPELVAPGVNVRSTDLFGGYRTDSGTSLAAPHVAGALALLDAAFPDSSADRQASALQLGAVDLGPAGPDDGFGWGRVDVARAYEWLRSAPDFSVAATPVSARTAAGGTVAFSVAVAPRNGYAGTVALTLNGLPAGQGSATFAPASIAGGSGSSQLTVATAATLAPGSYPLRIVASDGALSRTTTVTLDVAGPPDFTLTAWPAAATVRPGGSATLSLNVGALNGFAGPVTLTASGLPGGARATFTPNPATAPRSATLTLSTTGATRRATSTVTITGTSGALRHQTPVTLTVQ